MATCCSCIKCFKSTCEIVSYCVWWLKFEISCFIKEVFWKTSRNSQINKKSIQPEVFSQRMFLTSLPDSPFWQSCMLETLNRKKQPLEQVVLKNFANFAGKNLCRSLFLIKLKLWGLQLYLRRLQHMCFLWNLLATILKNICERLLLNVI